LDEDAPPPTLRGFERLRQTLDEANALLDLAQTHESSDVMSNQLAYFSCFTDTGSIAQHRLRDATVLVLGLGGTGSVFLQHMVSAGVGGFVLVDHDVVEPSNLNRQHLFTQAQSGNSKVASAREYVLARRPASRVTTIERLIESKEDVVDVADGKDLDLAFIAIDKPVDSIAHIASAALADQRIPFLHAGVGIRRLHVGRVGTAVLPPLSNARTTTASFSTTNAMTAGLAAHRALEFLTQTPMPFELVDEVS
jgi:hypothetical protein